MINNTLRSPPPHPTIKSFIKHVCYSIRQLVRFDIKYFFVHMILFDTFMIMCFKRMPRAMLFNLKFKKSITP